MFTWTNNVVGCASTSWSGGQKLRCQCSVKSGDNFTACFEFNANGNSLRFVGLDATYSRTNLGRDQRNWQAVTNPTSDPTSEVSIALSGQVRGDFIPDRRISGNAINSNGTTYTFNGTLLSEPTCPIEVESLIGSENPFLK
ncbi:hypothetical protein [Nostoc sp. ChiSLP03a]|uniref:hypothetical protein n=1 Tax=Nostoc sp. ChiSLP03a TaxID=3075380 RepID=UPI002AD3CEF1|nr:hypothetical protein [Nostoc sp. ChiSLP03a]MDZ8212213.1 hypothetical protein [Nostoc sp. ChiSLP03a]